MRKVGNFRNEELSNEQCYVLADFIASTKNVIEAEALVKILLTESEIAAVGQRLAILRMIAKDFTYSEIEDKLKTSTNTITKSVNLKDKEKSLEKYFNKMLKSYRYKPEKFQQAQEKLYRSPKTPSGVGIRSYLREDTREKNRLQNKKD